MSPDTPRGGTAPFLLEIGSEEIPARFIPEALADLESRLVGALREARLEVEGVRVMATPRRMALFVERLGLVQPDREVELKGPPLAVAFDADGAPTPAATGFARKAGIDLEDCERGRDERGEYLLARRTEPGRGAAEVLAEAVPAAVLGIPFRKVMRWGDHDLEYARPLQWIVALLGPDVVPLHVGYVRSGRATRGHRTLAEDRVLELASPGAYVETLRAAGVVVDHRERAETIRAGLTREVSRFDAEARLVADEELLTEVVFLCEHPTPFLGRYDEEFAVLPPEVIVTALKAHQRYFSVGWRDRAGLAPRFAAVRDGGERHLDAVVRGNERVLRARLADALFYWSFDQRRSPDERVAMLGAVTWLEGFGSLLDKTRRLENLAGLLWDAGLGDGGPAPAALGRAATLCKSDLVSEMIKDGKEFTKLEGFIGARYAEQAGEDPAVCRAIEHHYAPRSAADDVPDDVISATLSLADRLDNVVGCWLAGFAPTGAKDPYALRRHVLAVLRILWARGARVDLARLLAAALAQVASYAPDRDPEEVLAEIAAFVRTRLEGYCVEVLACDADLVRAVAPVRWADPVDALAWVRALDGYREREDFQQLATGFKRCRNILEGRILPVAELDACLARWRAGGRGSGGEDLAGLPEAAEAGLLRRVAGAAADLESAESGGEYEKVFDILSSFGPAIDAFFNDVRVNVEDENLRARRHAFLREIHGLFARYADFTAVAPADA